MSKNFFFWYGNINIIFIAISAIAQIFFNFDPTDQQNIINQFDCVLAIVSLGIYTILDKMDEKKDSALIKDIDNMGKNENI